MPISMTQLMSVINPSHSGSISMNNHIISRGTASNLLSYTYDSLYVKFYTDLSYATQITETRFNLYFVARLLGGNTGFTNSFITTPISTPGNIVSSYSSATYNEKGAGIPDGCVYQLSFGKTSHGFLVSTRLIGTFLITYNITSSCLNICTGKYLSSVIGILNLV